MEKCNKQYLFLFSMLILLFSFGMTARAAQTRIKNSDGSYSCYQDKKLLRRQFVTIGSRTYYAGADGKLYTNGIYKIGSYYYGFGKTGRMRYGKTRINGYTYYFCTSTGRMQRKKWISIDGKYYYFLKSGKMAVSQWVGSSYVGADGARVSNTWVDDRYIGSSGTYLTGLQKIGKYYYYLKKGTGKKVVNKTLTIKGATYEFNAKGRGTVTATDKPSVSVEGTYYTDPSVDDTALLASIIYCEAGNQSLAGQMAVGMVLMNRVNDPRFPSRLKEVVYQKNQFSPAGNGALTKALKNYSTLVTASCNLAAQEVMLLYTSIQNGGKVKLTVNGKKINFQSYLFFLPQSVYSQMGLSAKTKTIGDHVFFKEWK